MTRAPALAHVVGIGLEGQAPQGDRPALEPAPGPRVDLVEQQLLLSLVDRLDGLQQLGIEAVLARAVHQRLDVLGKQEPP